MIDVDKHSRRRAVCGDIAMLLEDDPDALGDCMLALTAGMRSALDDARARSATYHGAMTSALILMDSKRVSDGLKDMLTQSILKGCVGGSNIENEMHRRFGSTDEAA